MAKLLLNSDIQLFNYENTFEIKEYVFINLYNIAPLIHIFGKNKLIDILSYYKFEIDEKYFSYISKIVNMNEMKNFIPEILFYFIVFNPSIAVESSKIIFEIVNPDFNNTKLESLIKEIGIKLDVLRIESSILNDYLIMNHLENIYKLENTKSNCFLLYDSRTYSFYNCDKTDYEYFLKLTN